MKGDWHKTVQPVMTAYKLVTIEFKWMGLQNKVEKYIMETGERRTLIRLHKISLSMHFGHLFQRGDFSPTSTGSSSARLTSGLN